MIVQHISCICAARFHSIHNLCADAFVHCESVFFISSIITISRNTHHFALNVYAAQIKMNRNVMSYFRFIIRLAESKRIKRCSLN